MILILPQNQSDDHTFLGGDFPFFPEGYRCKNSSDLVYYKIAVYQEGKPVSKMDPAVKKETGYILFWVILLSVLMEAVFLILRKWNLSVLFGNLGGSAAAVGSFFLLAVTVSRAVSLGKPEEAAKRVKASAGLRLIGMGGICALLIGAFHTNVYATVIPLLFPRVGLMFRPLMDKKRGGDASETE